MYETTLIVIRHGETEWNREKRMQGTTDTLLSDVGRAQAQALARAARPGRYLSLITYHSSRFIKR